MSRNPQEIISDLILRYIYTKDLLDANIFRFPNIRRGMSIFQRNIKMCFLCGQIAYKNMLC